MPRHILTTAERKKGGKTRQRQMSSIDLSAWGKRGYAAYVAKYGKDQADAKREQVIAHLQERANALAMNRRQHPSKPELRTRAALELLGFRYDDADYNIEFPFVLDFTYGSIDFTLWNGVTGLLKDHLLAIEVDGYWHSKTVDADLLREQKLKAAGWTILHLDASIKDVTVLAGLIQDWLSALGISVPNPVTWHKRD